MRNDQGVTLVELLLFVAIMAILASVMSLSFSNYQNKSALDNAVTNLENYLRDMQQRAISQEILGSDIHNWGVYIDAVSGDRDYYETFYGESRSGGTVLNKATLSPRIQFSSPAQGNTQEIIFSRLSGFPVMATTIILSLKDTSICRKIVISANGGIDADSPCP